jgi:restriction system protein
MTSLKSQVPPWPVFVKPLLEVLSSTDSMRRRDATNRAAELVDMSDEARAEVTERGEAQGAYRAGWAIANASKAGLIENVARGVYRITQKGRDWLREYPDGLETYADANRIFAEYWPHKRSGGVAGLDGSASSSAPIAGVGEDVTEPSVPDTHTVPQENPVELIEAGVDEIKAAVADELLTRLRESHPDFFEEAVVSLLLAMGYGGAEQRGKRIGGTGDGGVDGVIDQDALGLDQIYIQAKRYSETNTVGRPEVQAFIGALHGFGASRGVFITTGSFTKGARAYADGINTRVILIDGDRLGKLMVKYKVGVQVEHVYEVVKVDEDFFE